MKSTITKFLVFTFSIVALLFILFLYQLSLVLDESLTFKKNSWEYYTLLSSSIKDLPIFTEDVSSVTYGYQAGDGTSDTTYSVTYATYLDKNSLLAKYDQFFQLTGRTPVNVPSWPDGIFYGDQRTRFEITTESSGPGLSVTVDAIDD